MKLHINLIKFTQILQDNDGGWLEKPVLVNLDYVQFVSVGKLERKGVHLVGKGIDYEREVTRVTMRDGVFFFVTEGFSKFYEATKNE